MFLYCYFVWSGVFYFVLFSLLFLGVFGFFFERVRDRESTYSWLDREERRTCEEWTKGET